MRAITPMCRIGYVISSAQLHDKSPINCCLAYSRKLLPVRLIRGYVRQFSNELCEINAVIKFYTRRRRSICANPEDKWVAHQGFLMDKDVSTYEEVMGILKGQYREKVNEVYARHILATC
ncbi:C-C motif chemokine 20-like [Narcine bancroftii]|uniref:C-C motif chemokine 20-like n=1 Tax=Narcine bancroftii TaxID=1343680 RepID=UPI003832328E